MTLQQLSLRARTTDWGRTLVSAFLLAAAFGVSFVLGRAAGRLTQEAYALLTGPSPEAKIIGAQSDLCHLSPVSCHLFTAPGDGRIRIAGWGVVGLFSSQSETVGPPSSVIDQPSEAGPRRFGLAGAGLQGASPVPLAAAMEGQVTVLVLGIDDLGAAEPSLEAVWLVVYRPPAPRVFVLGLSPETAVSLGDGRAMRLREAFAQAGGKPGRDDPFWGVLQTLAPATPTVTLQLDREGLARLMEFAGGAKVGGVRLSPEQALRWMNGQSQAGPLEALEAQAELLRGAWEMAVLQDRRADAAAFLQTLDGHLEVSVPTERLLQLVASLLPLESVDVHVQAAGGRETADGWVIVEK